MDKQASAASEANGSQASVPATVEESRLVASESPADGQELASPPPAATVPLRPLRGPRYRRSLVAGAVLLGIAVATWWLAPRIGVALNTVSTDDAYVNGHVTFVAPRVAGQVARVLVDDNQRVKKGDLVVELDKEPYQVEVAIRQAAVDTAKADLAAAKAQAHAQAAQARSSRYNLEHAMETVRNELATLKANVAQLEVEQANLKLAERDYVRNRDLAQRGAVPQADFDQFIARRDVAISRVTNAEQIVQQTRASLGLPIKRENPLDVPADLDQNFSLVREALGKMIQAVAPFGFFPTSWNVSPREAIAEFYKQDPQGNLDRIYAVLIAHSPAIKQAQAKLEQTERDLDQAQLNLKYCDIVSEIDGVVTRRNVNPGNNVQVGQSLMAVRSLTEIWIDANFKETQLADLRIGQRVRLETDMYGRRREYEGRITGFTMGTGQTLALLPPQNATGNFVKIVQRLPVRIELTDYNPDQAPLFVGLSVVPYVYYREPPTGPNAGKMLQPTMGLPRPAAAAAKERAAKERVSENRTADDRTAKDHTPRRASREER
jgi:membrane fusion protein (multidrug efflux system)